MPDADFPSESEPYQYWAFLSYSHQDNLRTRGDGSGDHIQWANWLHEQLEIFRIPGGYRDRTTRTGEPMPERFFPAFRDEAELPTAHDLGGQIRDALARSRFLIVIASPRSARSRYVNEELRHFRQLGRGDLILTLIVDGEPNVRLHPKAGWTAADDCFCPALVHPLRQDGEVDTTRTLTEEPIAADVRVKDTEPPHEMRASEREQPDRRALLDFMKLKLIAGLMGVGLDELVQRDKRRAEEELRRVRREASRTEFLFARQLLDLKDYPKAYARLAKAIESDSENSAAKVLGLEEIRRTNRSVLQQYLHKSAVLSAAFSPDGTRILTASEDKAARLWDVATGRPLAEPLPHEEQVCSPLFSPDGSRILTVSGDKTVRLWDAATGQSLAEPLRHEEQIRFVVFSPDGTRILTTSSDNTARLWDATSGEPLVKPLRHADRVWSAVFSPDGTRILTTSKDDAARLWDAATGRRLAKPLRHKNRINVAVFSPDGTRILTAAGGRILLWDTVTGRSLAEPLWHEGEVFSARFSPDSTRILTASNDNAARIWDAATGQPLAVPLEHADRIRSAMFGPDGTRILTRSSDNTARLWDAASGEPLAEPFRHEAGIWSAVFSPDGARILTASDDKTARLWDATGRSLAEPLVHEDPLDSAVFSPNGSRILTASVEKAVRLWDAATGRPLTEPLQHEDWVRSAVFSPDGTRILTSSDNTARLWDAATGQPLAEPLRHESVGWVLSAVFSPDGTRILTGASDGTARLWDIANGQQLREPLLHESWVRSAVFSPDGVRILTASDDRTARLWDAATGRPLTEPLQHENSVNSAVFSPDGTRILTSSDNTARLWDAATGQPLAEPLQHEGWVRSAAFSPNGARILTASDDKTARLWDAATGQLLAESFQHEGWVRSAVFSPDDGRVLTASVDYSARLWDVATGELLAEDTLRLRELLEIIGCRRLNDRGLLEPVRPTDIERLRRDFDTAIDMDRLLRWWWSDPFTRKIHPSSQITAPEFIRRRIREYLDHKGKGGTWYGEPNAFPHHPLILLRRTVFLTYPVDSISSQWQRKGLLSRILAAIFPKMSDGFPSLYAPKRHLFSEKQYLYGNPDWLAQYAVTRLLTEPHYHIPLPAPRNDAERAARAHELTAGLAEDCFLAARLLQSERRTDLARRVLARAIALAPDNADYRELSAQL